MGRALALVAVVAAAATLLPRAAWAAPKSDAVAVALDPAAVASAADDAPPLDPLPDGSGAGGAASPARWRPRRGLQFQYQLVTPLDPQRDFIPGVQVYFIDGWDTSAETVAALKALGNASAPVYPVCYLSVGTREDWRPDAPDFLERDKGAPLASWPGEVWVDVTSDNVRRIMRKRFEMCRDKGFVAIDPDNVNAYTNANGLGLTEKDQLAYNKWLAQQAHELGLAIGLKNDLTQIKTLAPYYDFFVNEQCNVYSECDYYAPVINSNKPIFGIEYDSTAFKAACKNEARSGMTSIFKKINLDSCRHDCSTTVLYCPEAERPSSTPAKGQQGGQAAQQQPQPQQPQGGQKAAGAAGAGGRPSGLAALLAAALGWALAQAGMSSSSTP